MSETPKRKRGQPKGLSIRETVKLWQEFMAVNGLSPMARSVRLATILMASFFRRGFIFRDFPKDIPILCTHDKWRFLK